MRFSIFFLIAIAGASAIFGWASGAWSSQSSFQFAIVGDRTGEPVAGVYQEVWHDVAADRPRFVITVGDTIQGENDMTMDAEWQQAMKMLAPYRSYRIFFTPGNHDVWSIASAAAYVKYTRHPLHYSFDYDQAHFAVLDNSRSDELSAGELAFLQHDLEAHRSQSVKFVFSHRPSWLLNAVLRNPDFALQRLAQKYGVKYVIAGHLHEMLHADVDGVTYISVASAGGHLRASRMYEDGWFFAHTVVRVRGEAVAFDIKEVGRPYGESRVTHLNDWGAAGLVNQRK